MYMRINYYRILLGFVDTVLINASVVAAFLLRFDGVWPADYLLVYRGSALVLTLINLISYYYFGLYSQIWAYASVNALLSVIYAVLCGSLGGLLYLLISGGVRFPFTVMIITFLLNILFVGGSRFVWRIAREKLFSRSGAKKKRVLIVGAGDAGESIVREMIRSNGHCEYLPVGFIDDNRAIRGMSIHGIKVLGGREDIPKFARAKKAEEVILAIPSARGKLIREVVDICKRANIRSKTLPALYELFNGSVSVNQIREINEEDLLNRQPVRFDLDEIKRGIEGKVVLITGAGGSIGSELSRQIARCSPEKLVLLGQGENSIYHIDGELRSSFKGIAVVPVIGNIRDREKLDRVMALHRPSIVFHAAAYKHVWMMEQNPDEAYVNNVIGTRNVAEAALRHGIDRFVLVSTDKAVNPTSVMGSTKRQAEQAVLGLAGKGRTRFMVTRFGNVMNSRGSVIPLFKKQIAEGRAVTVTHPDVVRFFMTIPEAVQLVIRAAQMGEGGEIFVLDMGEPVKILDLAKELISLSGLEPGKDVPIEFIGLKPGEKLFEALTGEDEKVARTSHEKIWKVKPKVFAVS